MNEKLDLAEILKDCPKGTKLWSPLCGECELLMVEHGEDFPVVVYIPAINRGIRFTEDGKYFKNGGECLLFPSREQWDWRKFQRPLKEGDVIYVKTKSYRWVSIFNNESEKQIFTYADYNLDTNNFHGADNYGEMTLCQTNAILEKRIATEEEKEKLFKAIKEHGYTWNAVTKTLEKLDEPKFKVGDRIKLKKSALNNICVVTKVNEDGSIIINDYSWTIKYEQLNNYELVSNKFDITTLKPFDRVLVRNVLTDKWRIGFFEKIDTEEPKYDTVCSSFRHCIPYNDETKHLLGKVEMEPEYYRVDEYLL